MAIALSDQYFGLRNREFVLNTKSIDPKASCFMCLFGVFDPRKPSPPSDAAYNSLKSIVQEIGQMGARACVVNILKYPSVVQLSRRSQTPINGGPKIMLFGYGGEVLAIYSSMEQKIPPNMISFVKKHFPRRQEVVQTRPPPSRGRSSRRNDFDDQDEEDEEDEYEERPKGRSGRGGYQPEFGNVPRVGEYMRGRRGESYDQDEGEEFLLPEEVTPHNIPWAHLGDDE